MSRPATFSMFRWLKSLRLAGFGSGSGPRRGVTVSAWSVRDWARALRGDLIGDLSIDQLTRSSAVVACSGLIADSLSAAPWNVVQRVASGGLRAVTQHTAVDALLTLTHSSKEAALFGCLTMGNGWLWHAPDGTLSALDSNRVMPYVDPQGRIWIKQGSDPYIAYSACAHLKWRSQPGYVLAFNPALLASDSIRADIGITRMAGAMASNAATPQGILSYPGVLSDDAAQNIRKAWTDINAGDQQGSVAILEEGLSYQPLKPNSFTDQQVVESLTWSASDIARIYNVPPTLIGLQKDSNRASSQSEERSFALRCLKPWGARIGDTLGRLLLSDADRKSGLCIEVDLSALELSGVERGTYLRELVGAGILTSNEARNSIGYEDAPDGGRLRFPLNTGYADQSGANQDAG